MGRRSRQRDDAPPDPPAPPSSPPARSRGREPQSWSDRFIAAGEARPKAPWHPVPLVEICVLGGIVLMIAGLLNFDGSNGPLTLAMGLVLASLAGLDTAARDHFSGFRSHTVLLSSTPAVLTAGVLFFLKAPWPAVTVVSLLVLGLGVWFFRAQFRARSGGASFRA